MTRLKFNLAEAVVIASEAPLRRQLRDILRDAGFGRVVNLTSLALCADDLAGQYPDLVVCDQDLSDGDALELSCAIRHGRIGANPFAAILVVSKAATAGRVQHLLQGGPDILLIQPFSAREFSGRLRTLVERRKLFVVTESYIGPDRRAPERAKESDGLVAVPNTLQAKAKGDFNFDAQCLDIEMAKGDLFERKRMYQAVIICHYAGKVVAGFATGVPAVALHRILERLQALVGDLNLALQGTSRQKIAELCQSLENVAGNLRTGQPSDRDLQLLPELAKAIEKAFENNEAYDQIAARIARYVDAKA